MQRVEISHKTIIFTIGLLLSLWLVVRIIDILLLIFIAFILMAGLRPLVDKLEYFKIPRGLAILLVYTGVVGGLGLVIGLFLPPILTETVKLTTQLFSSINQLFPFVQLRYQDVLPQIGLISQNIAKVTYGIFSNAITLFMLFVFTFYLLLERKNLSQFLHHFVGQRMGLRIKQTIVTIEDRIGNWIRGQLVLMLVIGVATYIGLILLRIPYALPLAVIAGLLEVVPNVGPTISAVPSVIVALTYSTNPFLAVAVAALYFIIQQLENTVVVPMVMQRVVGLPPLITIVALLVGGRLAGLAGILFAVPFILIAQTVIQDFWLRNKN